ncbi:hypothetical protein [Chthonomonas sp.]|uniref:hypothetical protein n=1 Tax=Chthonomonas sp. TaxID=2282153 RepID=UPI0039C89D29
MLSFQGKGYQRKPCAEGTLEGKGAEGEGVGLEKGAVRSTVGLDPETPVPPSLHS